MFNSNRENEILNLLMTNEYIDIETLSEKFDVSTRTIRRDIANLNKLAKNFDLYINYEIGLGYKITNDKKKIRNLITYININKDIDLELKIFLSLLNSPMNYYELEKKFLYSESTIRTKVNNLKYQLSVYDLEIVNLAYTGLDIVGKESDKRQFLFTEYFVFVDNILINTYLPGIDNDFVRTVSNIVIETLKNNDVILTDFDFNNLIAYLLISIYRQGFYSYESCSKNYNDLAYKLIVEINNNLDTKLGLDEISYISDNTILGLLDNSITDRIDKVIQNSISKIEMYSKNYYNFQDSFINAITVHLDSVIKRGRNHNFSQNPLLDEIKQNYALEYSDATIISQEIKDEFNLDLTEDDIGYIAIHLSSTKKSVKTFKRAVLICNYGIGTSQIVKLKLENENEAIKVIGVYPAAYLSTAMALKPDLVISTVRLNNFHYKVPLIESDRLLINGKLNNLNINPKKEIRLLLSKKMFFDVSVEDKKDFFDLARNILVQKNITNDKIIDSIIERENIFSTDFIDGVAIPHIIVDGNNSSKIVVFRLSNPINWGKNKVSLVFIIMIHENEKDYIESLKVLYQYILEEGNINRILKARDYEEFINDLTNI